MAVTLIDENTNEIVTAEEMGFDHISNEKGISIIEYAQTEMATFAQKAFTVVDSLVLAQLTYMNLGGVVPGVEQIGRPVKIRRLYRAEKFEEYVKDTLMPKQNRSLLNAICASPRFRDVEINYYIESSDEEKEKQFCAMTFFLPTGEVYVAYRGTDTTINGWKEDFNLFFLDTIPGQHSALRYLKMAAGRTARPIYVGGHSKGGNLAMYAASFAGREIQDRIIQVFNHDGPGLTKGAMAGSDFSDIGTKMNITLPRSSVIGLIFCHGNYTVVKSDRIGILQHDPFTWQIDGDDFIYYREVKPGANKLIDAVYELMETLDGADRELFVDTVFEIIYSAGATNFSEFPAMAFHSRDKILETMKNIEPETADKMKNVISELIRIVARKSFSIPENEISGRLNETLDKISEATEIISGKVTETTDIINEKVAQTKVKLTEATEKLTEKISERATRLTESTGMLGEIISETVGKAREALKTEAPQESEDKSQQ